MCASCYEAAIVSASVARRGRTRAIFAFASNGDPAARANKEKEYGMSTIEKADVDQPKVDMKTAPIEALGMKWRLDPVYKIDRLSIDRRVQVRHFNDAALFAPKAEVARYAQQMDYEVFPPLVVTEDGWLIDGNTTGGACLLRNRPTHWAVIVDTRMDDASPAVEDVLTALGAIYNMKNGRALSPRDVREAVKPMVRQNFKNEMICRSLGLSVAKIATVKREIEALDKLARLGLTNGTAPKVPVRVISSPAAIRLNDPSYLELVKLAALAGLQAAEVAEIAVAAGDTHSQEGELAVIAERKVALAERIREFKITGPMKPSPAGGARQHAGYFVKYRDNPAALVERRPEYVKLHREVIEQAFEVIKALRDLLPVATDDVEE